MKRYLILSVAAIFCMGLISCGKKLSDYPESTLENVTVNTICLQMFGDEPNMDNVFFVDMNVQEYSEEVILEGYDGENWRVLYNCVEDGRAGKQNTFSKGKAALLEYNETAPGVMSIDLSGVYEQLGAGKYRVLKAAVTADTKETCYIANEIVLLDKEIIGKRRALRELLYTSDVASIELIKGNEVILMDVTSQTELLDFTMEMQCVGVREFSPTFGNMMIGGSTPYFYSLVLYMADGGYVRVNNSSGKDPDGNEYCAVCTISGLDEVVLLYSEQEWIEVLMEKLK